MRTKFEQCLTPDERTLVASLDTPQRIQAFLDTVAYEPAYFNRCPLRVLRERRGHCYDGAVFAAAILRRLGYPPQVIDLIPESGADDDHMVAIFRQNGRLGAVAKSNFAGLRYREPVYRSYRELVMSYFEHFFNTERARTLRGYSTPLNLAEFDALNWECDDAGIDAVERRLPALRRYALLPPAAIPTLTLVDARIFAVDTLHSDPEGFYRPGGH